MIDDGSVNHMNNKCRLLRRAGLRAGGALPGLAGPTAGKDVSALQLLHARMPFAGVGGPQSVSQSSALLLPQKSDVVNYRNIVPQRSGDLPLIRTNFSSRVLF